MLFHTFANRFMELAEQLQNSPGEIDQKAMALRNHLLPFFGDVDMENLQIAEVRAFTLAKQNEGLAVSTINRLLSTLSRFLTLARDERVLLAPVFRIYSLRRADGKDRFLSPQEMRAVLRAAALEGGEVQTMVTLALQTGMRIGELLALSWESIDFRNGQLTVQASYCRVSKAIKCTKNRDKRVIRFRREVELALRSLAVSDGQVFHLSYDQAERALKRIVANASVVGVTWHVFRHTFASNLIAGGIPLFLVSRVLGHKSVVMTERYAHLAPAQQENMLDVLAMAPGI